MKENNLAELSMAFSVDLLNALDPVKGHKSIVNQLERSATSIGANIHEANYAHSKADFVSKMEIALKESFETEYWLELFSRTNLLPSDSIRSLQNQCGTIRRLLIASITTTKQNI